METITNLAHSAAQTASSAAQTATKAVWGEGQSHEEPVSGKMGNVAKGEPYDAGNIESNDAALKAGEQEDTERMGTEASASTAMPDKPASGIPGAGPAVAAAAAVPGPEDDKKLQSSREEKPTTIPGTHEKLGKEMPHEKESEEKAQKEEARTAAQPFSPAGPAKNAPSAISMRDDSTTAQSDTRAPASAPSSSEESNKQGPTTTAADIITGPTVRKPVAVHDVHDEQKAKVPTQDVSPDVDTSGPGPRPLQDIAREHGWDAGATKKPESTPQTGTSDLAQRAGPDEGVEGHRRKDSAKSLGGEAGGAGETKLAMRGKEVGGEQYVHASGLKADGGDFDASRPGAGREADRLLDEKGVHHGKEAGRGQEAEHNGKEKHSLKDKIKAKLHKTHMAP